MRLWGAHWPRVAEPEGRLCCSGRGVLACSCWEAVGGAPLLLLARCPRLRLLGGCWRGASVASGEGSSRAAVGDPLAGVRCASEG